jgi:predicted amidohydrolase YtcJ
VLTVDAHDTVAQAVAIRRGVILKAGSDADIQAFAAPDARVMDQGCRFHANES